MEGFRSIGAGLWVRHDLDGLKIRFISDGEEGKVNAVFYDDSTGLYMATAETARYPHRVAFAGWIECIDPRVSPESRRLLEGS